ncbi:ATP-binding cassette domain-containing protein [Streptomyces sp. NPDC058045]|uniref:ATP-binding cassette domain-containing protein n=1 Tax=Streptomyces sp. NPDC058045 TaxID=3346311 RepID=UPI0036EAF344
MENLVVRYGRRTVLDIPDLTIGTGVTALTGANGAGKTTLLKVCAHLAPPTSGSVGLTRPGTEEPVPDSEYRRMLGYLPQEPEFPGHFKVEEAVTYSAWLRAVPARDRAAVVADVLDRLRLRKVAATPLKKLSGGNRQRVYIAQAVLHRPAVLLLDEPTTGIDVEHRLELREVLAELGQQCRVVLSTHHTEDIELLATRVVSLRDGKIVFDGTPAELLARGDEPAVDLPRPSAGARSIERALRELGAAE